MTDPPIQLVTTKSDAELAEELKEKLMRAYEEVCRIYDEATASNFLVNVAIGPNAFGRHTITQIMIARRYVP